MAEGPATGAPVGPLTLGVVMSNAERPERTREHYIEALGRNHVERFVLLQGHATNEPRPDYGYDIVITTFDYKGRVDFRSGEIENGSVYVQLKSTDRLKVGRKNGTQISMAIKRRHVAYWIDETFPVILVVYSVLEDRAYWLHMQSYLKSDDFTMPPPAQEEITVHLSKANVVDEKAIEMFREYKTNTLGLIEGLNLYG